jgi:predicted DCC family thiol-disulfide oxidoreductase YuxK
LLLFFTLISSKKKDAQRFAWQGIWALMAVAYTVSGLHKLGSLSWVDGSALAELLRNPLARSNIFTHLLAQSPPMLLAVMTWSALALEILFAPLALFVTSRFYVWLSMVLMHLGILMVVAFADLTIGMLILHLFTFDPRWLRPKALLPGQPHPVFFYDGSCGMCNQFVQRVLKYDTTERFRFAPLQGDYARKVLPPEFVKTMNTLVLQDEYETIHVRSNAFLEICKGIGGAWSLFGILRLVPRAIRDWGYDIIATYRHRLFPAHDVCRMLTPEERTRFM